MIKLNDNTYTQIQNYLFHGLSRVQIKVAELQTMQAICRLTLGFHLTERVISYEQMTRITGFDRSYQARLVKSLLVKNMISRYNIRGEAEIGKPKYCYSVNLDPLTWNIAMRLPSRHFASKQKRGQRKKALWFNKATECGLIKPQSPVVLLNNRVLGNMLKDPFRYG